jgi:hypothetical protein
MSSASSSSASEDNRAPVRAKLHFNFGGREVGDLEQAGEAITFEYADDVDADQSMEKAVEKKITTSLALCGHANLTTELVSPRMRANAVQVASSYGFVLEWSSDSLDYMGTEGEAYGGLAVFDDSPVEQDEDSNDELYGEMEDVNNESQEVDGDIIKIVSTFIENEELSKGEEDVEEKETKTEDKKKILKEPKPEVVRVAAEVHETETEDVEDKNSFTGPGRCS